MKQTWKTIASVEFNEKEKQLLSQYYPDAYKIAYSFKAPQISDDVRENIAFNALQRSVKAYDDTKNTKFTTFLYLCIHNSLKSEVQRLYRRPYQISEIRDPLTLDYVSIFNVIPEKSSALQDFDWNHYHLFVSKLKERLNDRCTKILEMLIDPDTYLSKYGKDAKVHRVPKRLTYALIANSIGKSVSKVAFEMKIIRQQAEQVLKEIEG